ncbi:MAG: methyltransferase domain-containing protein [Sulfurimonas sp.]|jgi:SAM-dependent methyltransferase
MIDIIQYKDKEYPLFQASGFSARFCFPFAKEVCKGIGFDIGCAKEEWKLEGAIPIDKSFPDEWEAMNLPDFMVDYIFSSHCLEHLDNWVDALNYWTERIRKGGVLFLYLPDYSQEYWRPFNNHKHIHILKPEFIRDYLINSEKYCNIFASSIDLNNSFIAMAQRK